MQNVQKKDEEIKLPSLVYLWAPDIKLRIK